MIHTVLKCLFQDIFANGGAEFQAINNTFDLVHQYSFDIRNVKMSNFEGNNFGFVTKPPFMVLDFDKYVTGGSCSKKDLDYKQIDVSFKYNVRTNFFKKNINVKFAKKTK